MQIKDGLLRIGVGESWETHLDRFIGQLVKRLDPEVDAEYNKKAREYISR